MMKKIILSCIAVFAVNFCFADSYFSTEEMDEIRVSFVSQDYIRCVELFNSKFPDAGPYGREMRKEQDMFACIYATHASVELMNRGNSNVEKVDFPFHSFLRSMDYVEDYFSGMTNLYFISETQKIHLISGLSDAISATGTVHMFYTSQYPVKSITQKILKLYKKLDNLMYTKYCKSKDTWSSNMYLYALLFYHEFNHFSTNDDYKNMIKVVDSYWAYIDKYCADKLGKDIDDFNTSGEILDAWGIKYNLFLCDRDLSVFSSFISDISSNIFNVIAYAKISDKTRNMLYECFVNQLLRENEFRLFTLGAFAHRNFSSIKWRDYQHLLDENDYALFHFIGGAGYRSIYLPGDQSTRFRNYAVGFGRNSVDFDLYSRGWVNDLENKDFSFFYEKYPNLRKLYVLGTSNVQFMDLAKLDSKVVMVNSFSYIGRQSSSENPNKLLFVGDINYSKSTGNVIADDKSINQGEKLGRLPGGEIELDYLESIYPNRIIPMIGDSAISDHITVNMTKCDFVHFSTHGIVDNDNFSGTSYDLINHADNLRRCKMALSGYNDDPNWNYLSAFSFFTGYYANVKLAFFDACVLGSGRNVTGVPVSMALSAQCSGVHNVIAYLDPVKDSIATSFCNEFYSLIASGVSIHDAFYSSKKKICPTTRIVLWE